MNRIVSFSGATYKVSHGFNLYIDISSACNASCPFCIAPTAGRKDGPGFFDGAKFALDFTEKVGGTVQIIGGEPLISRRLPALLEEIGAHDYRRVVVNTNGSRISDDAVSAMRAAGVSNVNISRHHYDERLNQEIMRLRPELPNSALATGAAKIIDSGIHLRMQCNLIKGYVDSVQGMLDYIDWCVRLGCNEISFSQIFPLSLFDHQVPIEAGYAERVQIDLRKLVTGMEACGKFATVQKNQIRGEKMSQWGSSNYGSASGPGAKRKFWFGPKGTYLSLKTLSGYDASGLPNETKYDKASDWELQDGVLAFAVLHPDGRVTASWDRSERLLFNPAPKEQVIRLCRSAVVV
ncbi:MAG: radical SAM protein [Minisyncoccia bacterium]